MIEPFAVILPSAGQSERFGSDIPKQYCKIGNKLVINYSLDLFLNFEECKKIIIAVSDLDQIPGDISKDKRIEIILGGKSRGQSVLNCFNHLSQSQCYINVLIHDAARPCLHPKEVKNFLKLFCTSDYAGMIFSHPCTDTLKSSVDGKIINATVERSSMWQVQTPQIFKYENLNNAYSSFSGNLNNLTDESSLFETLNEEVFLYKGSPQNIKITLKEDLQLAEFIIRNHKE